MEVAWGGITGSNEGKSVCLACAVPYVLEAGGMMFESLDDVGVNAAVAVARQLQPEAPGGWLLGVAITWLLLKDGLYRESVERVFETTLDNISKAVGNVKS